jgi:hypothetical protein
MIAKIAEIEKQELTAETRRRGEDRYVPIWEILRGAENAWIIWGG